MLRRKGLWIYLTTNIMGRVYHTRAAAGSKKESAASGRHQRVRGAVAAPLLHGSPSASEPRPNSKNSINSVVASGNCNWACVCAPMLRERRRGSTGGCCAALPLPPLSGFDTHRALSRLLLFGAHSRPPFVNQPNFVICAISVLRRSRVRGRERRRQRASGKIDNVL